MKLEKNKSVNNIHDLIKKIKKNKKHYKMRFFEIKINKKKNERSWW